MPSPFDLLAGFSEALAALAAQGAAHVVRVQPPSDARRRAAASGVVWSADGVVVTTHHALARDEDVQVGLPSGEEAPAEVVGRDPSTDLAVLRIAGSAAGLAPAPWADVEGAAAPRPGALAFGISRPGRSARVSAGVVARVGGEFRAPGGGRVDRWIETTLDLHPGFSGGLVLGPEGRGLGLATAGLVRGAAMAVPPATLRRIVKALLTHGEVPRGYLGLATHPVPLPPELRARTGEELALLVSRVEPDGPAARAGILLGDALLSFGDDTLQDPGELLALLAEDRIGDTVAMKLLRGGEVREVQVTIGARGAGEGGARGRYEGGCR